MAPEDRLPDALVGRRHLLTGRLGGAVERIEVHRVLLGPGQQAPPHRHPGGVVGYVEAGEIVLKIEGDSSTSLRPGDVFFEPPGARIVRFDNASDSAPATFVAFYPLTGEQPLVEVVP